MRPASSSLGFTILAAAVAVGVMTREESRSPGQDQADSNGNSPSQLNSKTLIGSSADAAGQNNSSYLTPRPTRHARADLFTPDALTLTAEQLTSVTHRAEARLEELTHHLDLTPAQQHELRPAVIRATSGYHPGVRYQTYHGTMAAQLGPALGRPAFEDLLFDLLDPEQQLDYAALVADRYQWWSEIIARLETKLEQDTNPAHDLPTPDPAPTPEHDPAPTPRAIQRGRHLSEEPEPTSD